ncbi:MAG: TonB-dependent receptor [candidate division KSB1 bacterium]|nr:TonB-dependent receptor [candidate division KSB1 bacterium]MDZ7319087.1 TonB-dependent receptor [candidate division KSB1 bacterium]MDZ7340769.1 TonB-dependent receptor [candidate division KSB1 bacterium]
MFNKILWVVAILICQAYPLAWSQTTGTITGTVTSVTDGRPLEAVNIIVVGTRFGAASDSQGAFVIPGVPSGKHFVIASRIGFASSPRQEVVVSAGATITIHFSLSPEPIALEQISVTATRYETRIADVPFATAVIAAALQVAPIARTAGDLLASSASVTMKGTADLNSLQTVSLRGSSDSQVLVLLDGQPLLNAQNASFDYNSIPIDFLDKIEIVKGGHSALYGSYAVGGVINFISRAADSDGKLNVGARSGIGSWNAQFHSLHASQKIGPISYFAAFQRVESDGDFRYKNHAGIAQVRQNNQLTRNQAMAKLQLDRSATEHWQFLALLNQFDRGVPGSVTFPSTTAKLHDKQQLFHLSYNNRPLQWWQFDADLYYDYSRQRYVDSDPWLLEDTRHKNQAFGFQLRNQYFIQDNLIVLLGYDFRRDQLNSSRLAAASRNTHGVYLLGQIKTAIPFLPYFNDLILLPAFRLDHYTNFGGHGSPKLGIKLSHRSTLTTSLKGNIGTSFRAPTFNDLFWPADQWSAGNPKLKPETGISFDVGTSVDYQEGNWQTGIELTYFLSNIKNLNLWKEVQPWFWMPQNIDRSVTRGIETQLYLSAFDHFLSVRGAYTLLDARYNNPQSGLYKNQLEYRPKNKLDLELTAQPKPFKIGLVYRYLDRSFKDENNTQLLPRSNIVDLNLATKVRIKGLDWQLQFNAINLFDKQFITFGDQPMPGRQFRATVGVEY